MPANPDLLRLALAAAVTAAAALVLPARPRVTPAHPEAPAVN